MFALSIVLLAFCAVDVNADIPDGVVYTDLRKTVIKGHDAVLKCQFGGTPIAVYWKKGKDPESAHILITWVEGSSHTISYVEDGACEMTDDFSLILKEVEMEDQGRYICQVANYKGILIHNFTDVKVIDIPDGVVYTDVQKVVMERDDAVLKCQFPGTPLAVYWKKGLDPESAPNLITWVKDLPPTGTCVEDGACEMTDDFSLIIKEVEMEDQGRYICRVSTSTYLGKIIYNSTDVKVINSDRLHVYTEPYVTGRAGSSVSLPCSFTFEVQKILWKRVYGDGGSTVETILKYTSDGNEAPASRRYSWSENYGLIIRDLHVSDEGNFTCLISTDGIEIENSTVLAVNGSATQSTTAIIVVVVIIIMFVLVPIRMRQYRAFADCFRWVFCWKMMDGRNNPTRQRLMEQEVNLDNLREQLKNYRPGKVTNVKIPKRSHPVINLGVFGVTGAGKSALINSLNFALMNEYEDVVVSADSASAVTKCRDSVPLTKHINIIENRAMGDRYEWEKINVSLMNQISGERGLSPDEEVTNREVIHCPILVHDIRTQADLMWTFLTQFTSAVCGHYGRHVMVVFTHSSKAGALDSHIKFTHLTTGVPEEYIWSFENYTKNDNNQDEDKNIGYLQFLEKCLEIGEMNIRHRIEKNRRCQIL